MAGETLRAEERIDRALARPDRRGLTTDGAGRSLHTAPTETPDSRGMVG